MAKKRAGWERKIYRGTAGSTAATQIDTHVTDINISHGNEYNETTDRGDGTAVPKMTEQLVKMTAEITFTMQYEDSEAHMVALLAAAQAGTVLAFKVERRASGVTEFDGDCYLDYESPGELSGGQEVTFTLHPTDDGGRAWTFT
jgi:hypothetical protein